MKHHTTDSTAIYWPISPQAEAEYAEKAAVSRIDLDEVTVEIGDPMDDPEYRVGLRVITVRGGETDTEDAQ